VATTPTARTIPFDWYSDPAVLRLEQERIFHRLWQYAGRADQVDEPGAFFTARAGDVPVVVVRGRDGGLRGFVNVCRHRGSLVCEGEGRRETLQCPYHAWTYDLDGSLRAAPRADREPGFDRAELGLLPVAVDSWGPFVFVNPDAEAAPLAETLGDLPDRLAEVIDVGGLAFHHRSDSSYEANWKVCAENYLECYHCAVAHPGFSAVVDVSPSAYSLAEDGWYSTQVGPLRGDVPAGEVPRGQFHFLFPNVTINVLPGPPNLSIGPVLPAGPERAERFLDYFFAPGTDEAAIADLLDFDGQVGREDTVLVERVQRGVRSGLVQEGRLLTESEQLVAHFDRLLVAQLGADA
jgi:phenylpropionate dioxygenase-like ring-hydroxylating dioxygenase large terminal subunit